MPRILYILILLTIFSNQTLVASSKGSDSAIDSYLFSNQALASKSIAQDSILDWVHNLELRIRYKEESQEFSNAIRLPHEAISGTYLRRLSVKTRNSEFENYKLLRQQLQTLDKLNLISRLIFSHEYKKNLDEQLKLQKINLKISNSTNTSTKDALQIYRELDRLRLEISKVEQNISIMHLDIDINILNDHLRIPSIVKGFSKLKSYDFEALSPELLVETSKLESLSVKHKLDRKIDRSFIKHWEIRSTYSAEQEQDFSIGIGLKLPNYSASSQYSIGFLDLQKQKLITLDKRKLVRTDWNKIITSTKGIFKNIQILQRHYKDLNSSTTESSSNTDDRISIKQYTLKKQAEISLQTLNLRLNFSHMLFHTGKLSSYKKLKPWLR